MERHKCQDSLLDTKGEQQSWRTDMPDYETYLKARVTETVWYCYKRDEQVNRTEWRAEK